MKMTVYSDGGARGNPGPAAIGVLVCGPAGETLGEHGEVIGATTNNVAEYRAVIKGLEMARALGELVARQMTGEYRVKTPHILVLFQKAKERERTFRRVTFRHVPRTHEKIRYADLLVNQALDDAGH